MVTFPEVALLAAFLPKDAFDLVLVCKLIVVVAAVVFAVVIVTTVVDACVASSFKTFTKTTRGCRGGLKRRK